MKIILSLILTFLLLSESVKACSCRYLFIEDNIEGRIEESSKIFKGKVLKVEKFDEYKGKEQFKNGVIITTFEIQEIYKGRLKTKLIQVFQNTSNCAIPFTINAVYIIYTYKFNGLQNTDQCTPSRLFSDDLFEMDLLKSADK
jgi:hypothetical protein